VNPRTDGLLAYYATENNLLDGSGNGLNGTAVGSPTFSPGLGSFGTVLSLSSSDCVDLGNQDVFNPSVSFSVSLWANAVTWGHVMIGNRGEDKSPLAAAGWAGAAGGVRELEGSSLKSSGANSCRLRRQDWNSWAVSGET